MIDLKEFNHAHDGVIVQIDFDFDYGNFDRIQEFCIKYASPIGEVNEDGSRKSVDYEYFQMIFDNPSNSLSGRKEDLPILNFGCRYIYEIVQLESSLKDYFYWQIRMCEDNEYIDIYAKDLRIEKIANPFVNKLT